MKERNHENDQPPSSSPFYVQLPRCSPHSVFTLPHLHSCPAMQHDDEVFEAIGNVKKDTEQLSYANHSDLNNHELDGIHDNLEFPTDEERATLRRVADTIPWNAYRESYPIFSFFLFAQTMLLVIAVVELAERFSVRPFHSLSFSVVVSYLLLHQFYGSSVVFTNYIQQPLPPGSHTGAGFANGQSGALGLGQRASTGLTTFYQFW